MLYLGVTAELSINQTRYVVKFTAVMPKDYKVSFLARFISPIESAQEGWRTNCNHLYLAAEHKIHSTENFLPLKMWFHKESTHVAYVLKQVDFQSHGRGTESSIL